MSENPSPKPGFLPQVRMLHDTDRTDEIYSRAFAAALAPGRRQARLQLALNVAYYSVVGLALAWIFSMAIDREIPVRFVARDVVNPGRVVHQGEQIMIRATRTRTRQCELVKRQSVVDGFGRRTDYEAERFDAYGPISKDPETDITGPYVPLDAAPGRGRVVTTFAWDCNILQRALNWSVVLTPPPLEFEIVPREATR